MMAKLYIEHLIKKKRELSPEGLEIYGRKVYSQTDEDGILEEIACRLERNNLMGTFVEIGVGAGTENNTLKLLFEGSKGVWIEGSREKAQQCSLLAKEYIKANQLKLICEMANNKNVDDLMKRCVNFLGTDCPSVFSIDVDGPDFEIMKTILENNYMSPEIIVCEYNGRYGPNIIGNDDYTESSINKKIPGHLYYGSGSSLMRWVKMLTNYRLVACGILGINAFFIRRDLDSDMKFPEKRVRYIYNPIDLLPWLNGGYQQTHGFPSKYSIYS